MAVHRIALLHLYPPQPNDPCENPPVWPGYGLRRVQAAIVGDPGLADFEVRVFEGPTDEADNLAQAIASFDPHLVAASIYVWSTPAVCSILRRLRAERPGLLSLLGGPSSREALFKLEYYRDVPTYIDAICVTEGEELIRELLRLDPLTRASMRSVPGLAVSDGERFVATPKRALQQNLDDIHSPYRLGLMPKKQSGFLESFRGCPLSCTFCEWGASSGASRNFSQEYLVKEMRAMLDSEMDEFFLLDAGLNLHSKAFRALAAAEAEVGLFRQKRSYSEVYPTKLGKAQLDFIQNMGDGRIAVGLQAADTTNLARMGRRFDLDHFERVLGQIEDISPAFLEIHLIHGLPSDTQDDFRRALEYVWELPGDVRIFHGLVLPDALMTRGDPAFEMVFDPFDLRILSHARWSTREMDRSIRELTDIASSLDGGGFNKFWWTLPDSRTRKRNWRRAAPAASRTLLPIAL